MPPTRFSSAGTTTATRRPGKALDWFDKARKRDPASAKAVEGYTLALIELDRFADAETASYDWNEKSEDNLAAYLIAAVGLLATDPPLKIAEPVLQRMANVIVRVKSLQGGEQLGWYAYNLGQVKTAVRWFETVRRWDPNYEPAAYGLAVARWALKDRAGVNSIIREWGDRSERIANIGKPVRADLRGSTPVVDVVVDEVEYTRPRAIEPPAYAETEVITEVAPYVEPEVAVVAGGGGSSGGSCTGAVPTRSLSPESALRRGWCLMDLNRPAEAAIAFEIALLSTSAKTREDAAYGASLANLRSGVTDRASVAASAAPMSKKRQAELTLNILSQQATAAYADGRYVEAILRRPRRLRAHLRLHPQPAPHPRRRPRGVEMGPQCPAAHRRCQQCQRRRHPDRLRPRRCRQGLGRAALHRGGGEARQRDRHQSLRRGEWPRRAQARRRRASRRPTARTARSSSTRPTGCSRRSRCSRSSPRVSPGMISPPPAPRSSRRRASDRAALPADWVTITAKGLEPAEGFPAVFGYNAIRIPLYLLRAGLGGAFLDPFAARPAARRAGGGRADHRQGQR